MNNGSPLKADVQICHAHHVWTPDSDLGHESESPLGVEGRCGHDPRSVMKCVSWMNRIAERVFPSSMKEHPNSRMLSVASGRSNLDDVQG